MPIDSIGNRAWYNRRNTATRSPVTDPLTIISPEWRSWSKPQ